jgi:hypothetical protein
MNMRKLSNLAVALWALALFILTGAAAQTSTATHAAHEPSFLLAVLPNIGTVYWRADCPHNHGTPEAALGMRIDPNGQSTNALVRAGIYEKGQALTPDGDAISWFACRADGVQWLAAGAYGEDGMVVGTVRVAFSYHQGPYVDSAPRTTIQLYPRRAYEARRSLSPSFLRRFIR